MSLLPRLSALLGAELESLIIGDMAPKDANGGNMKKLKFYVCPGCGNIITGDSIFMKRLYPEWDMQTRLPWLAHGKLVWYCTQVLSAVLAGTETKGAIRPPLTYCVISSSSPGLTEPSLSTFTNMPSRGMTQSPAALRMAQS